MKLLEFASMIDIKNHYQASMVYRFFDKKTGSETSLNEQIISKESLCDI